jgi:hypothetical protein
MVVGSFTGPRPARPSKAVMDVAAPAISANAARILLDVDTWVRWLYEHGLSSPSLYDGRLNPPSDSSS